MSTIEIARTEGAGERCWGIRLLNEGGEAVVESTEPLTKGTAHATAKALKHGALPRIVNGPLVDQDGSVAVAGADDDGQRAQAGSIEETAFRVCVRVGGEGPGTEAIDIRFTDAEIRWSPPEDDPAHRAKESDRTETKGLPGS